MTANLGITLNLDFAKAVANEAGTEFTFVNDVEKGLQVASAVWVLNIPGSPSLSGPGYWNSNNELSVPGMTGHFTVAGKVVTKVS